MYRISIVCFNIGCTLELFRGCKLTLFFRVEFYILVVVFLILKSFRRDSEIN